MRKVLPGILICCFMACCADFQLALAQKKKGKFAPPANLTPSPEMMEQIAAKTAALADKIAELRKNPKKHALLPDVEIYLRGAENIVRFNEFYNKNSGTWTLDALDEGLRRADQLSQGATPWTTLARPNVLRAYRSQIDGTAQPYGVTYPNGYGKDVERKWRVDIVLHGRNSTLTEVSFLNQNNGTRKPMPGQDWVQIDIFGRGNNAYRWAGETDVFEAIGAFFANEVGRNLLDHRKVVLRGFSMGGAGAWHLGLHHPDKWCVIGPGAGFTTTHGYAWKGKKDLPDYQEKCLRIYDAIDYVENARMIPIVAYSGGEDAQKLAADNIEDRLNELKIDAMTHLVAPGLGHTFPPDWVKKANVLWSKHAEKVREAAPKRVQFCTYTTRHPGCHWVIVGGLSRHYEKATVDAEKTPKGFRAATKNVRLLALVGSGPYNPKQKREIQIDGQQLLGDNQGGATFLERTDGKWKVLQPEEAAESARNSKTGGLQGPIDDAFTAGFTCVLGSGETWHPATQKFVDAKIEAFKYDWAKHWRGKLATIGDYAVTPNEIMDKNLILFGDPNSNLTLAQILPRLPLKWTKDTIEFGGKKYKASEHLPVMIFPNPLNPRKYVVLNTGMTIPSEDYVKTNALLYPRLGDYAILRMTGGSGFEVATAGLFDEFWRVEKK